MQIDLAMLVALVGIIGGIISSSLAILNSRSNKKRNDKAEGQQIGVILTKLEDIKTTIDGINRRSEIHEEDNIKIVTRLTAVEESAKSAHKRIDTLETKI